jgi:iron complex outermembrane receptor protein
MGSYGSFEYFSSIIYRNGYKYLNVDVDDSFNFSLGTTYNISQNTSISLKGENLFDNSTESLYKEGLLGNDFAMEDYQREVTLTMKWVF